MRVLVLGGSRRGNIGYHAALRLLDQGAHVTYLLRNPDVLFADPALASYVASGHAKLVKGDALVVEDVRKAWEAAAEEKEGGEGGVDYLIFSVGGTPTFNICHGAVINPPNLCTASFIATLSSLSPTLQQHKPKLIVVTSNGLTPTSHAALSLPMRAFYSYALDGPHKDKLGVERVRAYITGQNWPWDEPGETILPSDWKEQLRANGVEEGSWGEETVIVRPALLTDGEAKGVYRLGENDREEGIVKKAWTVSRKDVAHYIAEGVVKDWGKWKGRVVGVAY